MTILVTGANGFIGSTLCAKLRNNGFETRCAVRTFKLHQDFTEGVAIGSISAETNWRKALENVKQVVHLAARSHLINDKSSNPLTDFRRVNVEGTMNLARQAAGAGVTRFIFLSSVKVNGESTKRGRPFTADDTPSPENSYGVSKHEAEQVLRQIAIETGMEVVIIRSPLVYGPGVKANFDTMMRWLARGLPLPLAALTDNRRSLVALDNLVDLIMICLNHPAAVNQTLLVSDGEDLSTADLLNRIGLNMGRPARLFCVSPELLRLGAALVNRPDIYQRLCGSLQVDISKSRQLLGWNPPISVDEGLKKTAEDFFKN